MHRLSSNSTLFLKIFVPVFWTTVVLLITLVLWFAPEIYFGGLPLASLRWAMLLVLLTGSISFWLFFWPLKRIEADGEYVYASNYFKTARYSWSKDVATIHEQRFLIFRIGVLELNGVGAFGQRMHFLIAKKLVASFKEQYPGLMP